MRHDHRQHKIDFTITIPDKTLMIETYSLAIPHLVQTDTVTLDQTMIIHWGIVHLHPQTIDCLAKIHAMVMANHKHCLLITIMISLKEISTAKIIVLILSHNLDRGTSLRPPNPPELLTVNLGLRKMSQ